MGNQNYRNFRNETIEKLASGKNLNGRQKIDIFRNHVKNNISSILENNKGLTLDDFPFLKKYDERKSRKDVEKILNIFESNSVEISFENKIEITRLLTTSEIINLDRKYLVKLLGIDKLSKDKRGFLEKFKPEFDKLYSDLLTRQILLNGFDILKTGRLGFYEKELTCSDKMKLKSSSEIMSIVKNILKDKNPKSGQGMFFNALIPENESFVLKSEREVKDKKMKEYQRRSVSHFSEVNKCLGQRFLPEQVVLKAEDDDRIFVLQEKMNLSKMKVLKYFILEDGIKDLGNCLENKENVKTLKDFVSGLEKLYTEKKLLIDGLGDNIFYEITDGKLNIKIIDTGCFETKWEYEKSEVKEDIAQMKEFIRRIKEMVW